MGLDMYLERRVFIGNQFEHREPKLLLPNADAFGVDASRVTGVVEQVMYWRKANQIHAWFIDNVGDDQDGTNPRLVSRTKLQLLHDTCVKVLEASRMVSGKVKNGWTYEGGVETPILEDGLLVANPAVAQELLPTQSGFFFGSTEYDQYYIDDLLHTVKGLEKILARPAEDDGDYYYRSSW